MYQCRRVAASRVLNRSSTIYNYPTLLVRCGFATKRQLRAAQQQQQQQQDANANKKEKEPRLIKTDLTQHVDWMTTQQEHYRHVMQNKGKKNNIPAETELESSMGIVKRDVTQAMIDLTDIYDKNLHHVPKFDISYEPSTPLGQEMMQLLAVTNRPMTCAEYMRQALTHPVYGYYTNPQQDNNNDDDWDSDDDWDKDDTLSDGSSRVIGKHGDFVTAPEISQVFGECLAVWFVHVWQTLLKSPPTLDIIEIGPGKGTLMADMLRTLSSGSFAETTKSMIRHVRLVEKGPAMRQAQRKALENVKGMDFAFDDDKNSNNKNAVHVSWYDDFMEVMAKTADKPKTPTLVICQEFIDALPVHVFEKTSEGWRERLVDIANEEEESNEEEEDKSQDDQEKEDSLKPQLRFVVSPDTTPALRTLLNIKKNDDNMAVGQIVEVCPEGILLAQDIATYLQTQGGGACLVVDYGQEGTGDSLRGFSKHKQVHVLSRPGQVDVTADVDFAALKHAVNAPKDVNNKKVDGKCVAKAYGPVPQGQFLASMGIVERVSQLIDNDDTTDKEANDLYMALERLVLPEQMGERYKVLAIVCQEGDETTTPAGFESTT